MPIIIRYHPKATKLWLATYFINILITILALKKAAINPAINIGMSSIDKISQFIVISKIEAEKIIGMISRK
jgi:hypothetical protein